MNTTADPLKDRSATTLELFFDLVFVFGITQLVSLFEDDPTVLGFFKAALILAMLWWTWSLFTWTTNWTGTEDRSIRFFLLASMGAVLLLSLAVPHAYSEDGLLFALPYFLVRAAGLGLYWLGSRDNPQQRQALLTFLPLAALAPTIVLIGGFVGDPLRTWLWVAAIVLDIAGAIAAGRGTWTVAPRHFAERNGLFVIIALGESVVAIGVGALDQDVDSKLILSVLVAIAGVAALWWSYFDRAAPEAEHHLTQLAGQERSRFARDAYSLLHYPLVLGIVLYAVAAHETISHPQEPLETLGLVALAASVSLVLLSVGVVAIRALRKIPYERFLAAVSVIGLVAIGRDLSALMLSGLVVTLVVVALLAEDRRGSDAWMPRKKASQATRT